MNAARAQRMQLLTALDEKVRRQRRALADRAREDFFIFLKHFAWSVLEPSTEFQDNWHIHTLCDHLRAVSRGEITRLIINMPFRLLKSTIVSQAFPAWEWINKPSLQYLSSSYAKELSTRDAVNSRRIIESPSYVECFGDSFMMTTDQNVKTRYENNKRGTRFVTSTDSAATGFGGNRIIVDDPISAKDADSEVARNSSIEWWRGTAATRFNNPSSDVAVITMQRLHALDLCGFLLTTQPNRWEHLVLPMRYETKRMVYMDGKQEEAQTKDITTKIGFTDPRTEEGELLFPSRLSEEVVQLLEEGLGTYHTEAQLQQRPVSRGGVIFKRNNWRFYTELPSFDLVVISVDCAFKDADTSDYVAIQVWGKAGAHKYLVKRLRERLSFSATVQAVRTVRANLRKCHAVLIEDKANGSAVIDTIRNEIPGVLPIQPEGGKVARAYAIQPQQEAGNLYLPDPSIDPSIETYLTELCQFPSVPHDDETDATTQAVHWFMTREHGMGIFNLVQQHGEAVLQEEAMNKENSASKWMGIYGKA